jgi:HsdM N-terminal domain
MSKPADGKLLAPEFQPVPPPAAMARSGGIANPLQVIEQITYLIFIKRLDEMQQVEERKATTLGIPLARRRRFFGS